MWYILHWVKISNLCGQVSSFETTKIENSLLHPDLQFIIKALFKRARTYTCMSGKAAVYDHCPNDTTASIHNA